LPKRNTERSSDSDCAKGAEQTVPSKTIQKLIVPEGWQAPKGLRARHDCERPIYLRRRGKLVGTLQPSIESDDFSAQVAQALRNIVAV